MSAKLPEHAMDCEVSGIIAGQWQPSTRAIHRICQGPTRSATSKDTRYTLKYRHTDGKVVLKVTNDRVVRMRPS
eukprot:scaffold233370_cov35-Tisochrysis_lutea.AAC.1